ncbi:MAG: hypothetical protein FJZ47_08055, partial [Candidatus Tectomicrobia bacterium]|nr:hypothetical protein [Candidatus Tectomicrobia bacterium]
MYRASPLDGWPRTWFLPSPAIGYGLETATRSPRLTKLWQWAVALCWTVGLSLLWFFVLVYIQRINVLQTVLLQTGMSYNQSDFVLALFLMASVTWFFRRCLMTRTLLTATPDTLDLQYIYWWRTKVHVVYDMHLIDRVAMPPHEQGTLEEHAEQQARDYAYLGSSFAANPQKGRTGASVGLAIRLVAMPGRFYRDAWKVALSYRGQEHTIWEVQGQRIAQTLHARLQMIIRDMQDTNVIDQWDTHCARYDPDGLSASQARHITLAKATFVRRGWVFKIGVGCFLALMVFGYVAYLVEQEKRSKSKSSSSPGHSQNITSILCVPATNQAFTLDGKGFTPVTIGTTPLREPQDGLLAQPETWKNAYKEITSSWPHSDENSSYAEIEKIKDHANHLLRTYDALPLANLSGTDYQRYVFLKAYTIAETTQGPLTIIVSPQQQFKGIPAGGSKALALFSGVYSCPAGTVRYHLVQSRRALHVSFHPEKPTSNAAPSTRSDKPSIATGVLCIADWVPALDWTNPAARQAWPYSLRVEKEITALMQAATVSQTLVVTVEIFHPDEARNQREPALIKVSQARGCSGGYRVYAMTY